MQIEKMNPADHGFSGYCIILIKVVTLSYAKAYLRNETY